MSKPYIPRADGPLRDWLENFSSVASREAGALHLTPDEVAMIGEAAARYAEAYARARAPGTRGRVTVAAKNAERRRAWDAVRPLAMRIKVDQTIDDAVKIELGVRPPTKSQSPIPRPRSAPVLAVLQIHNGAHRLKYEDRKNPGRRAKPPGVTAMQLFVAVNGSPARDVRAGGRLLVRTRHIFDVTFPPSDAGRTATYFGRWVTKRGLTGPWSSPVSVLIAFAGATRAA